MSETPRQFKAHDLKPGDKITWDFRGDRLGEVEVFDAEPLPGWNGPRPLVRVVLLTASGKRYRYRNVDASTVFAVR